MSELAGDNGTERTQLRTEELFEALRARILSDEWPPGARLPGERDLSAAYDTNRNTLREAIRRLEQCGLVTVRQGQGVTVCDFRKTGTLELVAPFIAHGRDVREKAQMILDVLEPRKRVLEYVVERFIERFVAEDLWVLEEAARALRAAEASRTPLAFIEAEGAFYEGMIEATRDQVVRWLARPLLDMNRDIQTRWSSIVLFEPSLSQFTLRLLSAVVARDKKTAVLELRAHYDAIDVKVRRMLEPVARELETKGTP